MDPSDRRYHPGLDGIRALAVGLVLVFHSGLGWVDGGFLGVSVFFTLSGFLITSLLLAEIGDEQRSGRVALGRFWGRRLRRLAPASLACLAAIAMLG
ncbi:MAG: acyltransferase, partial [Ilumatobacteraceae bacterium]